MVNRIFSILCAVSFPLAVVLSIGSVPAASTSTFDNTSARRQIQKEFDCSQAAGITQYECTALVALYNSTGGDEWNDNTDWLVSSLPCTWFGVTCSGGHVVKLDLNHNYLQGNLPAEIGQLTYLQFLDLSSAFKSGVGNEFSSLPSEMGKLIRLEELDMGFTRIEDGKIPDSFSGLISLKSLSMHWMHLSGPFPAGLLKLQNLERLDLSDNTFSGPLPPEISNLKKLKYLYLGYILSDVPDEEHRNHFFGPMPRTIMDINLAIFDYSGTQLCAPPDVEFQDWLNGIDTVYGARYLCLGYLPSVFVSR